MSVLHVKYVSFIFSSFLVVVMLVVVVCQVERGGIPVEGLPDLRQPHMVGCVRVGTGG